MTSPHRAHLVEIAAWLREHIQPGKAFFAGPIYRASAYLSDGTYLPCVGFRNPDLAVDHATRALEGTRGTAQYARLVKSSTTAGNRVSCWKIARVEKSRFAIATPLRDRILAAGETKMGWLSFRGRMDDGTEYSFDSFGDVEFFEMPDGYSGERLIDVAPHQMGRGKSYRALPFFECALDELQ